MRTPWRMLSDLMSGKSSRDDAEANAKDKGADKDEQAAREDSHGDTAAVIQPEANDEITDVIAPGSVAPQRTSEARAEPSADKSVTEIEPERIIEKAPAVAEAKPVDVVVPQQEIKPAKPAGKRLPVTTPNVAASKRPATKQAKKTAPVPALTAQADNVPVDKSVFEEMSALDHEIEDLRRRLSEKLTVQNAQLRKLIDRYDGQ